jgi:hypothetical protein
MLNTDKTQLKEEVTEEGRRINRSGGPIMMSPGGTLLSFDSKEASTIDGNDGNGSDLAQLSSELGNMSVLHTNPMSTEIRSSGDDLNFSLRELFGGAIIAKIPDTYLDVSDVRQVPDHVRH